MMYLMLISPPNQLYCVNKCVFEQRLFYSRSEPKINLAMFWLLELDMLQYFRRGIEGMIRLS